MAVIRSSFGEPAPAAADFQQAFARCQLRQDARVLAGLRARQIIAFTKQCRGIGHAGIKPQLVELVSHIVMRADIAPRSAQAV